MPDELLVWGKEEAARARWRRSWAHEAERLIRLSEESPLDASASERLLARLEGLVVAALAAGRDDLLVGFDLLTAQWLGLHFTIEGEDGLLNFGSGDDWDYQELRVLVAAEQPAEAVLAAQRAKQLFGEVFDGIRVGGIRSFEETQDRGLCGGCGETLSTVVLALESGSQYCGPCWRWMTDSRPVDVKRKRS